MTDRPIMPTSKPRGARPGLAHADVPSESVGLPGVGEEASSAHFTRDMEQGQVGEHEHPAESRAPADPRDGEA